MANPHPTVVDEANIFHLCADQTILFICTVQNASRARVVVLPRADPAIVLIQESIYAPGQLCAPA